jgi:hypothetical protein
MITAIWTLTGLAAVAVVIWGLWYRARQEWALYELHLAETAMKAALDRLQSEGAMDKPWMQAELITLQGTLRRAQEEARRLGVIR